MVVVLAAVVIGVIYYYSAPREQGEEGFLIRDSEQHIRAAAQASGTENALSREDAYAF